MHVKSGQAAIEYMLTVGIVLIIVIPTAVIFYRQASDSAEEIDFAQINKFGKDVIANAEKVYYLGHPSRIVLEERLPNKVENISVVQDPITGTYVLIITVRTDSGITDFTYPTSVGITGDFGPEDISPGIKNVNLYAGNFPSGPIVAINLGNSSCTEGTILHNQCSAALPSYCFNGVLIDDCTVCGCPVIVSELQCKSNGLCLVPVITGVAPSSGDGPGGTPVTISGNDFIGTMANTIVTFGGVAGSVTSVSATVIAVDTPNSDGVSGPVDVVVTNPDGGTDTLVGGFTYNCLDIDGDTFFGLSALCPAGDDCNDGIFAINPGAAEVCDGLDNDCNPATSDGSGESAPLNSLQDGVCLNSVQSCTGSWTDDYSGVSNYEAALELSCLDALDNDCDNLVDVGDPECIQCDDLDGDGFDAISALCPGSNDCNDDPGAGGANVFQNVINLADDTDQDRWYTGALATQCVGTQSSFWYKDTTGAFTWLSSSDALGATDCDAGDGAKWRNRYPTAIASCQAPLTCVGSEVGFQDTPPTYTVFTTAATFSGDLGGVTGADTKCNAAASAAGLTGTYTAWIAGHVTTEPGDRGLSTCSSAGSASVGWKNVNGVTVADSWGDLTDGSIDVFMDVDENGATIPASVVFSNVFSTGAHDPQVGTCDGFTSVDPLDIASAGSTTHTNARWTQRTGGGDPIVTCSLSYPLYCFRSS